jgi:hypothetical protein
MLWVGSPTVRRDRTRRALAQLQGELEAWFADRAARPADELGHHANPLRVLAETLRRSLDRIANEVATLSTTEVAFPRCAVLDAQLALIERYWRYYRERLEQRDDQARRRALMAADHVVWSCFTGLGGTDPSAVPLAFFDPTNSPVATPRTLVPQSLRTSDRLLSGLLTELPLPLIALPSAILDSPWWLVLLAHEVGHHLQYDLEPKQALVGRTSDAIAAAAGGAADRWLPWRYELFADACSVVALGPAAIHAIAELEWGPWDAMCADRAAYPPTVVRLATMCELAAGLGMAVPDFAANRWRTELAGHPARTKIDDDLSHAAAVAAALGDLTWGGTPLRARADGETLGPRGVAGLRARLAGQPVAVSRSRRGARLAAAAAFAHYQQNAALDAHAPATLALIEAVADGTTRGQPDLAAMIERCAACFDEHLTQMASDATP